ncbi:cytochrome c oxidase subunit I [Roseomonas gilardii]|uniref:cytochrome-c oxidase n=1 Tax=Roseomonas gilardii TaxID=257708 RepID=A0A1L7ALE2_9PROT|nr:cytochrome c oxidase subunit I [Roseomonas gilardii]APT59591.1 cytochrome c oxidase subunit I [Roseomonas gilardii]
MIAREDPPERNRPSPVRLHKELERIWATPKGWGALSAVNHTVIGKRFIVTAFVFFAIGGLLSMLIRAQLATPRSAFLGPEVYNQVFTMHGTVMMFLFAIPMFEGLAIYLLPKILGARDMAFPRLGAYGYWCYVFGGSILIVALLAGVAPDSGWFLYTPLSSKPYTPGINADVWLLGITFVEISAVSAAVEITVTILKLRAPGMSLDRMPIYAWYLLVTAGMMLVGFPPLILGSLLLEAERAIGLPFFDPTRGGDPLLWQHLFWLFGHPEVYIIFLPAAGAISTMLPVFARRELLGYTWIVVAVVAVGFLSFGLWVHHMFTVGIPHLAQAFFSAASTLVAVPTAVQIFAWTGTLASGRPRLTLPMLYILGFFFVFTCGGLTGVMLAVVPFDWQVHDTQFVVAHLHYVLVGGFIFPMLGAAYYWLPHVTGRMPVQRLGVAAFWLIFLGFNATFFLMHLTGLRGMPRRIHSYEAGIGWEGLNLISSVGGFILTMGFALFLLDMVLQFRFGRRFRRNPWEAETLEWAMPTPATSYAFASLPEVAGRAPLRDDPDLGRRLAAGEGYLPFARQGHQETLAVEIATGKPEQIVVLPRPSFLPLWSALATGVVFVALLLGIYWLAPLGLLATVILLLCWTPDPAARRDSGPIPAGRGLMLPPHAESGSAPSLWAMRFTLVADATLFASLLFGAAFLYVVAPNWPPPAMLSVGRATGGWLPGGLVLLALALAAVGGRWAVAANARGRTAGRAAGLLLALLGHGMALAALLRLLRLVPDPTAHAVGALGAALLAYAALHAALGLLFAGFGLYRGYAGYLSPRRGLDLRIGRLWHDYTAMTGAMALLAAMALCWGGLPDAGGGA